MNPAHAFLSTILAASLSAQVTERLHLPAGDWSLRDLVHHAENGLLFRANDRYDLARTLVRLTREPELVDRVRAGVRKPKGMIEHATEMEKLYTSLLHHKGQRPVS